MAPAPDRRARPDERYSRRRFAPLLIASGRRGAASGRVIALLLLCICAQPGQTAENGVWALTLENDLFYNVDRHYTNGVQLIHVPGQQSRTPDWAVKLVHMLPLFPKQGEVSHGYAFGQSMFTPADISLANPSPQHRPYAGWLYGSIGLGVETGQRLDQLALTIGMVGPASLAKQNQRFVHHVIGSPDPKGWATQLKNEPGIILTWQRSWRAWAATTLLGNDFDVTPHTGIALGNIYTYASTGLTLRYGPQLPADYGPPRIPPGLPGSVSVTPGDGLRWYLFAGVDGRAVARNIFLDGNSFTDSRRVDKRPLVGDLQLGLVLDWSDIRLSYIRVLRSREFRTQNRSDDFGAVMLSFRL